MVVDEPVLATYMASNKQEHLEFRNMLGIGVKPHGLG